MSNTYRSAENTRETAENAYQKRVEALHTKIHVHIEVRAKTGFFFVNVNLDQAENDLIEDEIVALQDAGYHVASHLPKSITISWTG